MIERVVRNHALVRALDGHEPGAKLCAPQRPQVWDARHQSHAVRLGIEGHITQPQRAGRRVVDHEVEPADIAQRRAQVRDDEIVVGRDGAVHAAAGLEVVLAHAQARLLDPANEGAGSTKPKLPRRSVAADCGTEVDDSAQVLAARGAREQVLVQARLLRFVELSEPVLEEFLRRRRARSVRHVVSPAAFMQPRSRSRPR